MMQRRCKRCNACKSSEVMANTQPRAARPRERKLAPRSTAARRRRDGDGRRTAQHRGSCFSFFLVGAVAHAASSSYFSLYGIPALLLLQ